MSLTIQQAADILGVHRTYINQLILTGKLAAQRYGNGPWQIKQKDFDKIKLNTHPWLANKVNKQS